MNREVESGHPHSMTNYPGRKKMICFQVNFRWLGLVSAQECLATLKDKDLCKCRITVSLCQERTVCQGKTVRVRGSQCYWSFHFSSVAQLCPTLCDPMDCSMRGFPVHHQLLELTQTHVHWVGDAIQPSHPLSPPSSPAFNLSQHQGLFNWVSSSHQVSKVLEFQLQHQSFQWIFKTDFL